MAALHHRFLLLIASASLQIIMRSFAFAALVGTASAAPAVIFSAGEAPKCFVDANGRTNIHYTDDIHPSFKCTHNADNTACSCTNPHPTHHHGACREFDHTDSHTYSFDGDCTDTGVNPVHGAWSTWTAQGSCSASRGDGSQTYTRTCDGIVNGGNDCSGLDGGSATKTETCKIKECPINGGWSGWGSCSSSGTKARTCTNPSPAHLGADCSALDGGQASTTCPVAGGWSSYDASWGACTKTCGGGKQYKYRTCTNPSPLNNGAGCGSDNKLEQNCNTQVCPVTVCVTGYSTGWGSEHTTRGTNNVGGLKDAWWVSTQNHAVPGGYKSKAECQSYCEARGAPAFNWATNGNGCRCYTAAQRAALSVTGGGWSMCSPYTKKAASCVQGYSSGWGYEHTTRGTTASNGLKAAMWISTSNHGVPGGSVTRDKCQEFCAVNGAPAFNWANNGGGCRCYTAAQRATLGVTGGGWSMCTAY